MSHLIHDLRMGPADDILDDDNIDDNHIIAASLPSLPLPFIPPSPILPDVSMASSSSSSMIAMPTSEPSHPPAIIAPAMMHPSLSMSSSSTSSTSSASSSIQPSDQLQLVNDDDDDDDDGKYPLVIHYPVLSQASSYTSTCSSSVSGDHKYDDALSYDHPPSTPPMASSLAVAVVVPIPDLEHKTVLRDDDIDIMMAPPITQRLPSSPLVAQSSSLVMASAQPLVSPAIASSSSVNHPVAPVLARAPSLLSSLLSPFHHHHIKPDTIDITHDGRDGVPPLRRGNWWWRALLIAFGLEIGGWFSIYAGLLNLWCFAPIDIIVFTNAKLNKTLSTLGYDNSTTSEYWPQCQCYDREGKLATGTGLIGAGLMMMLIALMFLGCQGETKRRRRPSIPSAAAGGGGVASASCESWRSSVISIGDWFWSPASPLFVEVDRSNLFNMAAGFALAAAGVGVSWWVSPCIKPALGIIEGPLIRICWCVKRQLYMCGGTGLMGAGLPLFVLSYQFRSDLARQKIVQATMRMMQLARAESHKRHHTCSSCGSLFAKTSKYCNHCGTLLLSSVAAAAIASHHRTVVPSRLIPSRAHH